MENLLDRFQAAALLRVSSRTVYTWAHEGKIPSVRVPGPWGRPVILYPTEDMQRLADERWGPITVPDDWGYWFSGLVDGEGSFTIRRRYGKPSNPAFSLSLRNDDGYTLFGIKQALGIGRLYGGKGDHFLARNGKTYKAKPQLGFQVCSFNECYKLTSVFDSYPLRSKKARDYAIWKESLAEFMLPYRERDQAKLRDFVEQIIAIKEYRAPSQGDLRAWCEN